MRRYVQRARSRALRATGVPSLPNLPSARTLARRAVQPGPLPSVGGRSSGPSGARPAGPSAVGPPSRRARRAVRRRELHRELVAVIGFLLFAYLLFASCGAADRTQRPCDDPRPTYQHDHC